MTTNPWEARCLKSPPVEVRCGARAIAPRDDWMAEPALLHVVRAEHRETWDRAVVLGFTCFWPHIVVGRHLERPRRRRIDFGPLSSRTAVTRHRGSAAAGRSGCLGLVALSNVGIVGFARRGGVLRICARRLGFTRSVDAVLCFADSGSGHIAIGDAHRARSRGFGRRSRFGIRVIWAGCRASRVT